LAVKKNESRAVKEEKSARESATTSGIQLTPVTGLTGAPREKPGLKEASEHAAIDEKLDLPKGNVTSNRVRADTGDKKSQS